MEDDSDEPPRQYLRVQIYPPKNGKCKVVIQRFSMPFEDVSFPNVSDLPEWITKKIAVLSMCNPDDHPTPDIPGVGRRISRSVYWVYY
jgi:hypothetical protein